MRKKTGFYFALTLCAVILIPHFAQAAGSLPSQPAQGLANVGRWVMWACGHVMKACGADVDPDDAFRM